MINSVIKERNSDGHWLYNGVCVECGYVQVGSLSYFKRKNVQTCTHYNKLTKEQKDTWYQENKKICLYCGKDIPMNGKTSAEYKKLQFCNRSCAASYNNMHRDEKAYYCQKCGDLIGYSYKEYGKRALCDKCQSNYVDWSSITYGDITSKRKYQINSRIRELARNLYSKSDKPKQCINCGYDKHYEVCHIKGISTFSDDTPISEINNLDNLIALCPNCHWEFDNGLLDLQLQNVG